MLDEKTMVADTLAGINGELVRYGEMIPQTENMQLKQVITTTVSHRIRILTRKSF